MSKVEGKGPIDAPPLMSSCDFFYLMPSRVKYKSLVLERIKV